LKLSIIFHREKTNKRENHKFSNEEVGIMKEKAMQKIHP
jgi:hypothetical protein